MYTTISVWKNAIKASNVMYALVLFTEITAHTLQLILHKFHLNFIRRSSFTNEEQK